MLLWVFLEHAGCHNVIRQDPYCEVPTLPRNMFHIVISGFAAKTCFGHYLWDLGISNADVFIYRRVELGEPVSSWQGPCGVRAQEVILAPNSGRDGAAFYDYVLHVYRNPPAAVMFLHGHGGLSYHSTCESLFSRAHMYYQSLALSNYTGLSKHMMTLTEFGKEHGEGRYGAVQEDNPREMALEGIEADLCTQILDKWNVSFKEEESFFSCCANFIVPGQRLTMYPEGFYFDLRALMINSSLDSQRSGRFCFEYIVYSLYHESLLTTEMKDWYSLSKVLATDMSDRLTSCKDSNHQHSC